MAQIKELEGREMERSSQHFEMRDAHRDEMDRERENRDFEARQLRMEIENLKQELGKSQTEMAVVKNKQADEVGETRQSDDWHRARSFFGEKDPLLGAEDQTTSPRSGVLRPRTSG